MSLGFKSQSVGVRANLCDDRTVDIWSMYSRTLLDILFLIWGQTVADYKMLSFHISINVIIIVVSFKILDLCPIALFQQLWNTLYSKDFSIRMSAMTWHVRWWTCYHKTRIRNRAWRSFVSKGNCVHTNRIGNECIFTIHKAPIANTSLVLILIVRLTHCKAVTMLIDPVRPFSIQ